MSTAAPPLPYLVIDFDSTFTQVEGLDELADIALRGHPDRARIVAEIKALTDGGMDGSVSFSESLRRRVALLPARREHLTELVAHLHTKVSESIRRNASFFRQHADRVYIVSSGFREFIEPVVAEFGIPARQVLANTFRFDDAGNIIGFDETNPLSRDGGKIEQLRELGLEGAEVFVLGDGYTDYQIREAGLADRFYAFTENVTREAVVDRADEVAPTFDEFLYQNKLPMTLSYPKNRIRVLLLENPDARAAELFKAEGYQLETVPGGLDEDELVQRIEGVSILGIRSKTQVTARVLEAANRLIAVGAFCIGTNQIDLVGCMKKGVAVFNAPFSNTRSVVELALAEIISLARRLPEKSEKMHRGEWDKSARGAFEIRGKKLGIVGYGNIGSQLSVVAEAVGMQVLYFDIAEKLQLGNARKVRTLDELLQEADIVTLHVDGRPDNQNLIGARELALMKPGALLLNNSRGHIVDVPALAEALRSGHLGGAAVDVFPYEPKSNDEVFETELRGLPNVLLTPHIGGSTAEAQRNIAEFVPERIIGYINAGNTQQSVNLPNIQLPAQQQAHRLIHIHQNVPGVLARINNVLAAHQVNILGQYLKTNEHIGYVITDVNREYDQDVIQALREVEHTIKFRVLY
ncbi:phosphoglycerate dehydrogenase [Hymenobacter busanensis]|uniref:D-3-phosphoglycerate dehydrogenase n=1 Tax=Hymenobacter busanensis TaxID=2607656 RepID=A0A7L5A2G8_9BACT|nr:phosphoglycerate dehydrogenase [Hymenobacter busanensis]KAA9338202.1 phosphoglycerate dehydrogenase [Hymenobacter busanensis]QHJ09373.1 phosphoglycerate dehydrogenase [Hymenobacter busanensis]